MKEEARTLESEAASEKGEAKTQVSEEKAKI